MQLIVGNTFFCGEREGASDRFDGSFSRNIGSLSRLFFGNVDMWRSVSENRIHRPIFLISGTLMGLYLCKCVKKFSKNHIYGSFGLISGT